MDFPREKLRLKKFWRENYSRLTVIERSEIENFANREFGAGYVQELLEITREKTLAEIPAVENITKTSGDILASGLEAGASGLRKVSNWMSSKLSK